MGKSEIKIVRMFNASRETVFRAWTEPKYILKWWGPEGFTCPHATVDFKVGGEFRCCMRAHDGAEVWTKAIYKEIVIPEKIVWVMSFSDKDGNILPASHHFGKSDFPDEMIDIVTFEQVGGQTRLTIIRNHSEELAKKFGEIEGWNSSLNKFEKLVSQ